MKMNPYIADILSQPDALRDAVRSFSTEQLAPLRDQLHSGIFDRLILSGMGSSFNAAYPAYVHLSCLDLPVMLLNSAELNHSLTGSIGSRTLVWLNSQSGRSAELVNLVRNLNRQRPAVLLSCVNDLCSPIAEASDYCLEILAGLETTVSTKTYGNMLAVNLLATECFVDGDIDVLKSEILETADEIEMYLSDWQQRVQALGDFVGELKNLMILGRGASMSTVWNGSLIAKEAAKCAFEGMHAADFRHGPLELAGPGFCALIFAGSQNTRILNYRLGLELIGYGAKVFWVDDVLDETLSTLLIPETSERTRPLVEILPLQMLTLLLARQKGIQAGMFRHIGKVTDQE